METDVKYINSRKIQDVDARDMISKLNLNFDSLLENKIDNIIIVNDTMELYANNKKIKTLSVPFSLNSGSGGSTVSARTIQLRRNDNYIQWRYINELNWTNLVALSDLKGDVGPRGLQGEKGEKGLDGSPGIQGPVGPRGLQGEKGEKGDKGDKGDVGEITLRINGGNYTTDEFGNINLPFFVATETDTNNTFKTKMDKFSNGKTKGQIVVNKDNDKVECADVIIDDVILDGDIDYIDDDFVFDINKIPEE